MSSENAGIDAFLAEWTAAELRGDTAVLERCLADDFAGVGPLGFTLSKEEWLARHADGDLRYEAFRLEEAQVRDYGDAAVVSGRQVGEGTYRGHPIPGAVRATLMLVRRSDGWRIVAEHMSFIAGTPGAPPVPGRPS